jgi:hypothetical protein
LLDDLIKSEKYEQAVKDVKRGKSMLQTAFPSIFSTISSMPVSPASNLSATAPSTSAAGLEAVFDK